METGHSKSWRGWKPATVSEMTTSDPARYAQEAETFVSIMRSMAPALSLDFSPASIAALETFIADRFDPPGSKFVGESLPVGVGCYVGETIIRTVGGQWQANGEVQGMSGITRIFPIAKAQQRFQNGPVDSLTHYYQTVARYAGRGAD